MAKIDVFDAAGKKSGSRELSSDLFEAPVSVPLMHQVVVAGLAGLRAGTHSTKTRGEVSGGGKKPWRQKGTGRARAGTVRAAQFTGGGVVFPPSPRSFDVKVNKKAYRSALRSALSSHAQNGTLGIVDPAAFDAPSTKQASDLIADRRGGSVLVVLSGPDEATAFKSFRNLAGVNVLAAEDCGVADIVGAATIVFSSDALDAVTARAKKKEVAV